MALTSINGVALSGLSAINGVSKASLSDINGQAIGSPPSGLSLIQTVVNESSGAGTTVAGTISASGSGRLIVVGVIGGGTARQTVSGVADNVSNTYVQVPSAYSIFATTPFADIWYCKNCTSGATTVTATLSGSNTERCIVIWEVSGADTSAPQVAADVGIVDNGTTSTTPSGPSITTTVADEFLAAMISPANSITGIHAGNAFTGGASASGYGYASLIKAATGAYQPQWDQTPTGAFCSSMAAFK